MLKFILGAFLTLLYFECQSQVSNECDLKNRLFLSASGKRNTQWLGGVVLTSTDSTNRVLNARFDIMKNWNPVDSLEFQLYLDTAQTYIRPFRDSEEEMLRFTTSFGLEMFIEIPNFRSYELDNGMKTTFCSFDHALIVFHQEWKKYQKRFDIYFEK